MVLHSCDRFELTDGEMQKKSADDLAWEEFLELRRASLSESRQNEVIVLDDESEPLAGEGEEKKEESS